MKLTSSAKSRKLRKKHSELQRRRRLQLENLEDRNLLATFDEPIINVPGQGYDPVTDVSPADHVGAAGQDYYLQAVNSDPGALVQIFRKSDGTAVSTPFTMSSLATAGTACSFGAGDPQVAYDHLANRWVLLEFMDDTQSTPDNPNFGSPNAANNGICIHVSQTSDPTNGQWQSYGFFTQEFPDYPKLAVWEDAYYVSTNETDPVVYAFDRENMLAGNVARPYQSFNALPLPNFGFQALTPSNLSGPAAPTGAPNYFARHFDDEFHGVDLDPINDFIEIYEYSVDFDDPTNSTFTLVQSVEVADFDSDLCGGGSDLDCIPQPNSTQLLDAIPQVIMQGLQYRNFGTHEALVGNFTVNVGNTGEPDRAGIRWFELRKNSGASEWVNYQENTLDPDANHRWMGSIAMNGNGDIAIGYNVSSMVVSPSIRYSGRVASDPLGTLIRGEHTARNGIGASTIDERWGDYSSMVVDPVDDTTFWFTGGVADAGVWDTQIFSVSFGDDPPGPPGPGVPGEVSGNVFIQGGDGVAGVPVYADLNNNFRPDPGEAIASTDRYGNYSFQVPSVPNLFNVRVNLPPGWVFTNSQDQVGIELDASVTQTFPDTDFSLQGQVFDFGNAPAPYPTSLADDGARFGLDPLYRLGDTIDGEADANPADTNDGVVMSALAIGQAATIQVDVQTNGLSAGRLHAFFDWNQDGDWNDLDEHVIANVELESGMHSLGISVPGHAQSGPSYARFMYGHEYNKGVTGEGRKGEVEDHEIFVLGDQPVARDDMATVDQNSASTEITPNVLSNDLNSAPGLAQGNPLIISQEGMGTDANSVRGGVIDVASDGSTIFYTPPLGVSGQAVDSFTYQISDGLGGMDTAVVTIDITPSSTGPVAVDDFFGESVFAGQTSVVLDLFKLGVGGPGADEPGQNPPISIISLTDPVDSNGVSAGSVTVTNAAAGLVSFANNPDVGFNGLATFQYTIQNSAIPAATSTATVTLSIDPTATPDILSLTPVATPLASINPVDAITEVDQGDVFRLNVFADDLRTTLGSPATDANLGALSAYLDVLYDRTKLAPITASVGDPEDPEGLGFKIQFGPAFSTIGDGITNAITGSAATSGLVDEVGSATILNGTGLDSPPGELLFSMQVRAVGATNGQPTTIVTDPNEVTLFETTVNDGAPSPIVVPFEQITYNSLDLMIVGQQTNGEPGIAPVALNDAFALGAVGQLNVLDNDQLRSNPGRRVVAVEQPLNGGVVVVSPQMNGVIYTPPAGNENTPNSFTYTMSDNLGLQSTATVTIGPQAEYDISFLVNGMPASIANVGDEVTVVVTARDTRAPSQRDGSGFQAVGLDLSYDQTLLDLSQQGVTFGSNLENPEYDHVAGSGLLDNVGGSANSGLGEAVEVYSATFTATSEGTANFLGAAPDANLGTSFVNASGGVDSRFVDFGTGVLQIHAEQGVRAGESYSAYTNLSDRVDVDGDGSGGLADILGVVRRIHQYGEADLPNISPEVAMFYDLVKYDVNGDNEISLADALAGVNILYQRANNSSPSIVGEGEAATSSAVVIAETADPGLLAVGLGDSVADSQALPTGGLSDGDSATVDAHAAIFGVQASDATHQAHVEDAGTSDRWSDVVSDDLAEDVLAGWNG